MKWRRRISPTTFKCSIVVFNTDPGVHGINNYRYNYFIDTVILHTTRVLLQNKIYTIIHFRTKCQILKSIQDLKCHQEVGYKT